MCGRYTESKRITEVKERIAFARVQMELTPRFNIAPTQLAPVVVVQDGAVSLKPMRWGLVPFWAKDQSIGDQMINARAETVKDKPAFRASLKRRRCLVVADAFYEWQKLPRAKLKQPMRILLQDEGAFVFAGLWDCWTGPDGCELETFTIITGQPNEVVAPIHNRMAVILPRERHEQWLDPEFKDTEALTKLLVPYPAVEVKAHPVSTLVNNPKFEDERCVQVVGFPAEDAGQRAAVDLSFRLERS